MICQVKMKSAFLADIRLLFSLNSCGKTIVFSFLTYGIRFGMKNEFVHFVFLLPFAIFAKLHAEYPVFVIGLVCFQTRWRGGVFY